jgi:hypothetical protein
MKRRARIIVALAILLALYVGSTANADAFSLRTYIPFEFTAGRTTLPPGNYALNRLDGSQGIFLLRSAGHGVFLVSHEAISGDTPEGARMVFNRYGERYFLREVWLSASRGYPLPETIEERELVKAQDGKLTSVPVSLAVGERPE